MHLVVDFQMQYSLPNPTVHNLYADFLCCNACIDLKNPKSNTFISGKLGGCCTKWKLNPSSVAASLKTMSSSKICGLTLSC